MGLSIRNIKKGLELKIHKCIALLGEEYTSLNYTIYFYKSKEELRKEQTKKPDMKAEHYIQILDGQTVPAGLTIGERGKIKIFLFHFRDVKKDPVELINLIGNLYHEIRHAWQYDNNLFQDEDIIDTIDGNSGRYYNLPSEKDAYRFQEEQMQNHGNEILRIFGFDMKINFQLKPEIKKTIDS